MCELCTNGIATSYTLVGDIFAPQVAVMEDQGPALEPTGWRCTGSGCSWTSDGPSIPVGHHCSAHSSG